MQEQFGLVCKTLLIWISQDKKKCPNDKEMFTTSTHSYLRNESANLVSIMHESIAEATILVMS